VIDDRDPSRLLDAADCDPLLRRVLETARGGMPNKSHADALALGIERAVMHDAALTGKKLEGSGFSGSSGYWRAARFAQWLALVALGSAVIWLVQARLRPHALSELPSVARDAPVVIPTSLTPDRAGRTSAEKLPREPRSAASPLSDGAAQRGQHPSVGEPGSSAQAEQNEERARHIAVGSGSVRSSKPDGRRHPELKSARDRAAGFASTAQSATPANDSASPRTTEVPPELQLLAAAQRALRDSPSNALALANLHARQYPSGLFVQEREEIAVEALLKLGDLEAGRARGRAFLAHYPQSTHASAIARMLDAAP
jgi:hypothetical protein